MKKKLFISTIILALILCVCPLPVKAETSKPANPLASLKTTRKCYYCTVKGDTGISYLFSDDYFETETYTDYNVELSVTSSNKKVMDVDVNIYGNPTLEKNGYSHGDFEYVVKGSGYTKITVKCRLYNDATNESYTYTKEIKYYLKKYSCPISSIKYGKTNFTSKFKKICAYCKNTKGVLPVSSFSYKFKKGYKFQSAYVADENICL